VNGPDEEDVAQDALVRALRAPATPAELAREADYRALYAANAPSGGTVRRFAGRIGLGATSAITTVVLTAGVAAAYTGALPDPVQQIAHGVLGHVGVPAPDRDEHPQAAGRHRPPARQVIVPPGPSGRPTALGTRLPGARGTATGSPSGSRSGSPSASPTSVSTTTAAAVPAALTLRLASHRVNAGSTVTVTGLLTAADGHPVPDHLVRLLARTATRPWTVVASARSGADGSVALSITAITEDTAVRLRAGSRVASTIARVVVVPVLTTTVVPSATTTAVTLTCLGGQAGDQVEVLRRLSTGLVRVATLRLGADGTVTFTRATPRRPVVLVFRLVATDRHAAAHVEVVVPARA
jgi:hypothetical protein